MDSKKPIKILMMISLIAYGFYALLYLLIFFNQSLFSHVFSSVTLDPYYNWFDLILLVFSAAARALLFLMVNRHLSVVTRTSFVAIGVYYLVLLVIIPVLLSHLYYLLVNQLIVRIGGSQSMAAYSVLIGSLSFITPLASVSNFAAFAGCSLAWYRNAYPPRDADPYYQERRYD